MAKWLQCIIIAVCCFTLQSRAQFTSVSFSIQAHQDDWQLFMPTQVMVDLNTNGRKVVFITLTAGDGSVGAGAYGPSSVPFYLSRENGAIYSSKYAADLTTVTAPTDVPVATIATINGHNITKYVYKNTVNYFLRIPDGNGDGSGFNNTGHVSLQKLYCRSINTCSGSVCNTGCSNSLSALGPTPATYNSWSDLTNTIKQIITNERVPGTQSWLHAAHTITGSNSSYNPGDHSDHRYSSLAAQHAVASGMSWVGVNGFMDYHSSSQGANLSDTEHENAAAIFALTNWGLIEQSYATNFNSQHKGWLPMDFFLVIKNPSGSAPGFTGFTGDEEIPKSNSIISTLTEIPMIVTITSPVYINKDISMIISPYEPGVLTTAIYDMAGNKITELKTTVEKREPLFITLKQAIKTSGTYVVKNILNDKYLQTRKITVE